MSSSARVPNPNFFSMFTSGNWYVLAEPNSKTQRAALRLCLKLQGIGTVELPLMAKVSHDISIMTFPSREVGFRPQAVGHRARGAASHGQGVQIQTETSPVAVSPAHKLQRGWSSQRASMHRLAEVEH